MSTKDKVPFFVAQCEDMGIEVLPPDVNQSGHDFKVVEGNIRFGLDALKGLGYLAVEAILKAREHETRLTRVFSGRPARGIVNRFMTEVERNAGPDAVLPFPFQNALTRPLRSAAARQGRAEFLSLWAGQGVRMARRRPAAQLVAQLAGETDAAVRRLAPG